MRSLVSLASMLFALAAALPAMAQREAQVQAWCFDRATDEQVIEGCSAVIAAGRESVKKLAQAYCNVSVRPGPPIHRLARPDRVPMA
jgi:hypothetical protein